MARAIRSALRIAAMLAATALILILLAFLPSPGSPASASAGAGGSIGADSGNAPLRIASMKGPTSIGLAELMRSEGDAVAAGEQARYTFGIYGAADAIVPLLVQGNVDIAFIPPNLAATLYGKMDGGITVIDANTLGVLYGVSQNGALADALAARGIEALRGAAVFMTGKGTVPQYTVEALLAAAGVNAGEVDIQYKSEPAEVVAAVSADPQALGILPQPYATAATMKNAALRECLDLSACWAKEMGAGQGSIVTGVTVVRNEVLAQRPGAVARFLADHAASVRGVLANPAGAAQMVVELGIADNAALVERAIPRCNLVCLVGLEMKQVVAGYLQALHEQNPASVGGALPPSTFYLDSNA